MRLTCKECGEPLVVTPNMSCSACGALAPNRVIALMKEVEQFLEDEEDDNRDYSLEPTGGIDG